LHLTQANAGAQYDYAVVISGAQRDFKKAGAAAEGSYISSLASADKDVAEAQVTALRDFRLAVSAARQTRDDPLSAADLDYATAAAQAQRNQTVAYATAEATALIAQYAQIYSAQQPLANWNLPWVDFQIALAAAEAGWAADVGPQYVDYSTA